VEEVMRELTMDELKDVSGGDGPGASTGISIALTGISALVVQNAATIIAQSLATGGCSGGAGTFATLCA
jgi:tRNA A37 threonylcarbamoyladenosine modification protein TsaB